MKYDKINTMKEIKVKTIFFTSDEERNLEGFINEFVKICSKNDLKFRDICNILEKIVLLSDND